MGILIPTIMVVMSIIIKGAITMVADMKMEHIIIADRITMADIIAMGDTTMEGAKSTATATGSSRTERTSIEAKRTLEV